VISLAKFPSFLVVIKKMTAPVERMTGDMDQEDPERLNIKVSL
jgi:hypothetical protein